MVKDYIVSEAFNALNSGKRTKKSLNESAQKNSSINIKKLESLLHRLNEAEMSPEDERENELLWSVYNKTKNGRANAKLTKEEQAVLDKYGLERSKSKDNMRSYTSINQKNKNGLNIMQGIENTYWGEDVIQPSDKINYADKARKYANGRTGEYDDKRVKHDALMDMNDMDYGTRQLGAWVDISGHNDDRKLTTKQAQDISMNRSMAEPVIDLQFALQDRKAAQHGLDKVDTMYDEQRAQLQREHEQRLADNENSRQHRKQGFQRSKDTAQGRIDKLLKRDSSESLNAKLESLINNLNEAEMSPEDKRDSEILRDILWKRNRRSNAKLNDEERAILQKYNLDADGNQIRNSEDGSFITSGNNIKSSENPIWNRKINLADKVRKHAPDQRGFGYAYKQYQDFDKSTGFGVFDDENDYSLRKQYMQSSNDLERDRILQNAKLTRPVRDVKRLLGYRKEADDAVANAEATYNDDVKLAQQQYDTAVRMANDKKERVQKQKDNAEQRIKAFMDNQKANRQASNSNESLNEAISDTYGTVANYFNYDGTDEFFDLVDDVVSGVEDFNDDEAIWEAIDNGLIYYNQQWEVAKHYFGSPAELDWDVALEDFYNDVYGICQRLAESSSDEEDED